MWMMTTEVGFSRNVVGSDAAIVQILVTGKGHNDEYGAVAREDQIDAEDRFRHHSDATSDSCNSERLVLCFC